MTACVNALRESLVAYRADRLSTDVFVGQWRAEGAALCEGLPAPYRKVLDDLLMRTESSRFFAGDSCSFSRDSLIDAFTLWLDKVQAKLASQA